MAPGPNGQTFDGNQVIRYSGESATPIDNGDAGDGTGCSGCSYTVLRTCDLTLGLTCNLDGPCKEEESSYLVLRSEPGQSRVLVNTLCLPKDPEPVPVTAITDAVRQHLTDELIPEDVEVALTPGTTALITAPTLFRAVGANAVTEEFFTAGFPVTVTATPVRFRWDFGDGHGLSTDTAGAVYTPGVDITEERFVVHRYEQPGEHPVRLSVEWAGSYVLAGVGTVDAGIITQPAEPVVLRVVEARTQLVDQ